MNIKFRTIKKSQLIPHFKEDSTEVGVLLDVEPEGCYAVFHPADGENGKWREVADPKNAMLFIPMMNVGDSSTLPAMPAEDYKTAEIWICEDMVGVLCCNH